MPTYITLIHFTDQGIESIEESPARADTFRSEVQSKGGEVHDIYWTNGPYDGVAIFSVPDEETATALMVKLGQQGKVRTTTMRAFNKDGFDAVLAKV